MTLGLWMRGQQADRRRVVLYLTLIAGFILGGVLGTIDFSAYRFEALIAPAALAAAIAVAYLLYWKQTRRLQAGVS